MIDSSILVILKCNCHKGQIYEAKIDADHGGMAKLGKCLVDLQMPSMRFGEYMGSSHCIEIKNIRDIVNVCLTQII